MSRLPFQNALVKIHYDVSSRCVATIVSVPCRHGTVSRQCGHTRQRLDSDDTGLDCDEDKTKTQTKTADFEELCGLVEQLNFSLAVEV